MNSFSDRLKAMGITPSGKPQSDATVPSHGYPIEKVVQGKDVETIYGTTFSLTKDFDPSYQHGWMMLNEIPELAMIAEWGKLAQLHKIDPYEIVFLDTETTGLAGGTGTYAFLIGLGYHTPAGFRVDQLFMRDPSDEPALLAALNQWLSPFKILVTFNGKSFDIPLLNSRYTLNGISSPTHQFGHVDLLHLARRIWRNRLPSRALGDLEKEIIGFYREGDEVPGYLIPQYYFDYLKTADARPLSGVLYHNQIDIVTLAALFNFSANLLARPTQESIHTLDLAALARLHEELGHLEQAAEMYERCITQGLPEELFFKTIERFAMMRRKQGHPELAAILWQHAAEREFILAYVELSKYHEHTVGDIQESLRYVNLAINKVGVQPMPQYRKKMLEDELGHRQGRLEKKLRR